MYHTAAQPKATKNHPAEQELQFHGKSWVPVPLPVCHSSLFCLGTRSRRFWRTQVLTGAIAARWHYGLAPPRPQPEEDAAWLGQAWPPFPWERHETSPFRCQFRKYNKINTEIFSVYRLFSQLAVLGCG